MTKLVLHQTELSRWKFANPKQCSCGKVFEELPLDAICVDAIWWFNCTCNSTLTVLTPAAEQRLEQRKKDTQKANALRDRKTSNIKVINKIRKGEYERF